MKIRCHALHYDSHTGYYLLLKNLPFISSRLALKLLSAISAVPWGCWPKAVITPLIVSTLSGANVSNNEPPLAAWRHLVACHAHPVRLVVSYLESVGRCVRRWWPPHRFLHGTCIPRWWHWWQFPCLVPSVLPPLFVCTPVIQNLPYKWKGVYPWSLCLHSFTSDRPVPPVLSHYPASHPTPNKPRAIVPPPPPLTLMQLPSNQGFVAPVYSDK